MRIPRTAKISASCPVRKPARQRFLPAGLWICAAVMFLAWAPRAAAQAPVAGQNINMVSGREWPGGDPFLQRQNEPSIAISSRNVLHLLAGANDYRTVDLPGLPNGEETGDAWLGVFKSFDGGQTWQSTLLPGYPQDLSAQGLASPLKGFNAAADPVVRAGTHGLFYYSGIAFNRGSNLGQVFVASFADLDNKENGDATQSTDPIKYIRAVPIDTGTSGQFLDKPWVAADVPRSGAGTCVLPTTPPQTIPAGNVYIVFSKFTGSQSTKIMFTRSLDCGATWSQPVKLSESNSINQGTQVAIDPVSGAVYVAWRRFATSSQSDAIVFAKSTDFGQTFTKSSEVATIIPFDQGTTSGSFRTNSLPSLAVSVDSGNMSRIHLAWAQRAVGLGDAQIVISTSTNGTKWSTPTVADPSPVTDEFGNMFSRGHQFMPELTFAANKLVLLYYDLRLDHTLGFFHPNEPFQPDVSGKYYKEERVPQGELPAQPNAVFTPFVTDAGLTLRRHTVDLRVAQATPGAALSFASTRVSQYRFGTRGDETGTLSALQQLQLDPPNFPLFAQGTVPFFGDYIDIAGQTFVPPATAGGAWTFNTAATTAPVFVASWTSNQDVRPPADGNWTNYTPVGGGASSIFDPTKATPACVSGQEGMRNQNIYSSRITQGLLVASPQDAKPLSATLRRAFVVQVQNLTDVQRAFRLQIANQPVGGKASFIQFPGPTDPDPLTTLDVTIPAQSGIARPVFATSTNPTESIRIQVSEITGVGGTIVAGGLSSFLVLNADGTVPTLANPDGAPSGSDISTIEIYNPNVSNPNITNPNVSNPNVSNPNVSNPNVSNPNISNPNVSNPNIANPNVTNPNVSNPNVSNPNVSNPNVSNPNITNASISDATYSVTNAGNTSTSYRVKLVGQPPTGVQLQLLVTKTATTPIGLNCQLLDEQQSVLLANITNPIFEPATDLTNPNITDPSNNNPTFALRPGETALITLRGITDMTGMSQVVQQVAPVVVPHPSPQFAAPLFITIATLPPATVGQPYNVLLAAIGGTAPVTWSVFAGSLPDGLTLDPSTGTISGTPTTAGTSRFTIQVTDSSTPAGTATRDLSLTVQKVTTTTAVTSSVNPSFVGQSVTFTATVTPAGSGTPTGTVTFQDGASVLGTGTLSGGTASFTTSALALGIHSITAVYGGDDNFLGSTSSALTQTVNKAGTTTGITSSVNPSAAGQAVTFTATVASGGPGTPTGSVTFFDGASALGTAGLTGGSTSLTTSSLPVGSHSITAVYSGDGSFLGSTSAALIQVVNKAATTTTLASSANPSAAGQFVTFTASVTSAFPGTPTGTMTFKDGGTVLGTVALSSGTASFATSALAIGTHSITTVYGGNAQFAGSTSNVLTQAVGYIFTGFVTPLATAGTVTNPTFSGSANLGQGIPIKWQLQDARGRFLSDLTTTTSLQAVFNPDCAGVPEGTAIPLYSPTSGATGGSTFRSGSNQFIFNWDTSVGVPTGKGCYSIVLQLNDGTPAKSTILQLN